MPTLLQSAQKIGHRVAVCPIHEYWIDVGRPETLRQAHQEWPTGLSCDAAGPDFGTRGSKGILARTSAHSAANHSCSGRLTQPASACVDQVVVSTDDPEIAEVARACGAEVPFLRPAELATDTAPGIAPVLHALEQLPEVNDLLLLQPTSPMRTSADIEAIVALRQKAGRESAVSLTPRR